MKAAAALVGIPATMETAAGLAAASLTAGRICAWDAAMIEAAGVTAEGCAARKSARWSVIEMIVIEMTVIEMIVIAIGSIVGDVAIVVVHHSVAVPVGSPVVPAPAEAAENADADPQTEGDPGSGECFGITNPTRIVVDRFPVDIPRIVFRHVNHVGVRWLDRDRLTFRGHGLLWRARQVS